jgi:3-deoxy-D-arabino-heptulosonate 7-phosphate (DAHP) synthase
MTSSDEPYMRPDFDDVNTGRSEFRSVPLNDFVFWMSTAHSINDCRHVAEWGARMNMKPLFLAAFEPDAGSASLQSRLVSLVESTANVAGGYGVAVVTQILIFPIYGLHATLAQNLKMGAAFTVVSIARSYILRRQFERLRRV